MLSVIEQFGRSIWWSHVKLTSKRSTFYQYVVSLCGIAHYCCFTCVPPTTCFCSVVLFCGVGLAAQLLAQTENTLTCFLFVQGAVLSVPPRFSNRVIIATGPSACSYGQNAIIAIVYLSDFVIAPAIFFFWIFTDLLLVMAGPTPYHVGNAEAQAVEFACIRRLCWYYSWCWYWRCWSCSGDILVMLFDGHTLAHPHHPTSTYVIILLK